MFGYYCLSLRWLINPPNFVVPLTPNPTSRSSAVILFLLKLTTMTTIITQPPKALSPDSQRTLGVVVVGLGLSGSTRLRELVQCPWVTVRGVVDLDARRVESTSRSLGVPGSTDLQTFLNDDAVDAVHCATTTPGHAPVTIAALQAGKHVFVEKPMAMNRAEALMMIDAERASGRHIQVNFQLRVSALPMRVKAILDAGEIGSLQSALEVHCRGGWTQVGGDRLDPARSAGAVMEAPIHTIDLMRWYGGDFQSAQVFRSPTALPAYPPQIPDNFTAVFNWPDGRVATLIVMHGRSAENLHFPPGTDQTQAYLDRGHEQSMSLIGSHGSLICDPWRARILVFRYGPAGVHFVREENFKHLSQDTLHHDSHANVTGFYRRLLDGKPPNQSSVDAWHSTATALAAEKSIRTGACEPVVV